MDDGSKIGLPPMGKVDFPKNACIVSGKTDEVVFLYVAESVIECP